MKLPAVGQYALHKFAESESVHQRSITMETGKTDNMRIPPIGVVLRRAS